MVDLSLNGQFRACSTNRRTENNSNRCQSEKRKQLQQMPIGKKKTALIDANRKKPTLRKLVSNETQQSKDLDFQTTLLTVF